MYFTPAVYVLSDLGIAKKWFLELPVEGEQLGLVHRAQRHAVWVAEVKHTLHVCSQRR